MPYVFSGMDEYEPLSPSQAKNEKTMVKINKTKPFFPFFSPFLIIVHGTGALIIPVSAGIDVPAVNGARQMIAIRGRGNVAPHLGRPGRVLPHPGDAGIPDV